MWARNLELSLGLWLAMSPFVFQHPDGASALWANDLICAALVVCLSLLAYWRPTRRAHLAELPIAAWLLGVGWVRASEGASAAAQNHILVGLLLAMLAIVPSHASSAPSSWRRGSREDATPGA